MVAPVASSFDAWTISSCDWGVLRTVRAMSPRSVLWPPIQNVDGGALLFAEVIGTPLSAVNYRARDTEIAHQIRERGMGHMVWTGNEVDRVQALQAMDAVAECTHDPRTVCAARRPHGPDRAKRQASIKSM